MFEKYHKKFFWVIVIISLTPLLLLPIISWYNHDIYKSSSIENCVLDLKNYDINTRKPLLLDGTWLFYKDKFIVSHNTPNLKPDAIVNIPSASRSLDISTKENNKTTGSYSIKIKNLPKGISISSYIPRSNVCYKIFIDGQLIYSKIDSNEKTYEKGNITYGRISTGFIVENEKEIDLVIEVFGKHTVGLYSTPLLLEENNLIIYSNLRMTINAIYIGMLILSICSMGVMIFLKDKSFGSIALWCLDLLLLIYVVLRSELIFNINIFLVSHHYSIHSIFIIASLFLPILTLLCIKQLIPINISNKILMRIFLYELAITPFALWCVFRYNFLIQAILLYVSCIPFVFPLKQLYDCVKKRMPYSLIVTAIILFIVSGTVISNVDWLGVFALNMGLFGPSCFVLSMFLQLVMYVLKNIKVQQQAVEAENLMLRLKESEINLMLSQIKPHFLFNALTAIHVLCTETPETASEVILKFAIFLRTNMSFINSKELISFEQELNHVQNYVDIEKMRFQKRLTVHYNIGVKNFYVPPLCIQPIIENAIKYGASKNIKGGIVTLKTFESLEGYFVEITDNGPGFDISILENPNSTSYGIKNITFRLKESTGAKMEINSLIGRGTTVLIIFPKK